MKSDSIIIKGAKEHNLKDIDLVIPKNKLVIVTGPSGSGKSSLAFDTIYADGQRRYVESLSAYARQFLERMEKPNVEHIEGLSPSISIEQKSRSKNPRSTVGTITEIYDYLRLLYARVGKVHCTKCKKSISSMTVSQMVEILIKSPKDSKLEILSPIVRMKKGTHKNLFEEVRSKGFVRARVNGKVLDLAEEIELDKNKKHNIEIVIDRIKVRDSIKSRLSDSIEIALKMGEGLMLAIGDDGSETLYSEKFSCPDCEISIPELEPRLFSFNSPHGACSRCSGLGDNYIISEDLIVPDPKLSISEGAIAAFNPGKANYIYMMLESLARHYGFSVDTPFKDLPEKMRDIVLFGSEDEIEFRLQNERRSHSYKDRFEGIINNLSRRYKETSSLSMKMEIENYMRKDLCKECKGKRLRKEALSVTVSDLNIMQLTSFSVEEILKLISKIKLDKKQEAIAAPILKEIKSRLGFMENVGLSYLSLDRAAATLSGGESQRIRLATQIGSALTGVIYVLDEPSIGLHQRDNMKLIDTLAKMRDLGNSVIVVEHDKDTILASDYIVDLGPGAGLHGGHVVFAGKLKDLVKSKGSITGEYISGKKQIKIPKMRREADSRFIVIKKASENNLKSIDVKIPVGLFTVITGVSGSGKSTLMLDILYKELARHFFNSKEKPGKHEGISGFEFIDKVIDIDQSPIGRTPRSNPATYTNLFNHIRDLFSALPESRQLGYRPGRFSFNLKGGRCEACQGDGVVKIEMHFLPDMFVNCDICNASRFNEETLKIKYKGKSIADILDMTIEDAYNFFDSHPQIKRILSTLKNVGLDYIKLGQNATTLSGGEAQRVKLSKELAKRSTGKTLYLLDEPTTGLHFEDIRKLLDALNSLIDQGNSVVLIEHNIDVIKTADHIIDLGPEGGDKGGYLVATGKPEEIAKVKASHTGYFLKREFEYFNNNRSLKKRRVKG